MKTLLLVDDFSSQRNMMKMLLQDRGYEFVEAQNGKVALELLKNTSVDGVITDLEMPEMDGLAFVTELRKTDRKTPVIMITSLETSKSDAEDAGVSKWLHKPFDRNQIIDITERLFFSDGNTKKYNVLLIDDVKLHTTLWEQNLKLPYFNFFSANSARDAVKVLRDYKIDLIVTDYLMPDVDGVLFIKKIKTVSEFSAIPIIIISQDDDIQVTAERHGADAVFKKPFNAEAVKTKMKQLCKI